MDAACRRHVLTKFKKSIGVYVVTYQKPHPNDFTGSDEIRVWRTLSATPAPAPLQDNRVLLVQECDGVWMLGPDREVTWNEWDDDGPVLSRVVWRMLSTQGRLSQVHVPKDQR